jgi:formylglycine-generating enzyme required for sulfatase activity
MTQVFLSHSAKDAEFAIQMATDLRGVGIPVWKAPESILPGEPWVQAIERGLTSSTHFVLLMSPAAVKSKWVNLEFDTALERQMAELMVIIPIEYESCAPPQFWRRFQAIPDFPGSYHANNFKLLGRIKNENPAYPPDPTDQRTTINVTVQGDASNLIIAGGHVIYKGQPAAPPEALEAERARLEEAERFEAQRIETERVEQTRLQAEAEAAERSRREEAERIEAERVEQERLKTQTEAPELTRLEEAARVKAKLERTRRETKRAEQAEQSRLKAEAEAEAEAAERNRREAEKAERQRREKEKRAAAGTGARGAPTKTLDRTLWVAIGAVVVIAVIGIGAAASGMFSRGAGASEATKAPTARPISEATATTAPTLTAADCKSSGLPEIACTGVTANADWTPYTEEINGVEMALVPAGCFQMGSENGSDDEKPVHKVCFDAPFWLDVTEVTQAQFSKFGGQAAQASYFSGDTLPREQIAWAEADAFCQKRGARLPGEAEWEYAARGPDGLVYPWGNTFVADNVVYSGNSSQTAAVGSRPGGASWVGALDLSGNVWEWVNDWYGTYQLTDQVNPTGAGSGTYRVLRGGSWNFNDDYTRAANRTGYTPDGRYFNDGFRCSLSQ